MSDTPRTDRHVSSDEDDDPSMVVHVEFARDLERDLAAANARIKELADALEEVAAHAPAELEPEDGARWVGMGTMMRVCAALAKWRHAKP